MTAKRMLEAIARLEGWTYSESYDIPSLEGSEDFSGGYNLGWLLGDLDIEEKRSSLDEKRQQLLDSYFESSGSKPREAVLLAAEAMLG